MNRETFFNTLADSFSSSELHYIQRAYWLVKGAHAHQTRRLTGERFFEHVRRVAMYPVTLGYKDAHMVALGLLHDVVEDTWVPSDVIVDLFGTGMYQDMLMLSKEIPTFHPATGFVVGRAKIHPAVYLQGLDMGNERIRIVKGSDRYDNLADLAQWAPERREKYILETEELLPIFEKTDIRIAAAIRSRLVA